MTTELVATETVTPSPPELDARTERVIWKGLGIKSVRQIASETGLAPEEVLRVKNELLDSVDVLTVQQRRQKILVDLQQMAQDARDRTERISDEFFAGTVNASVGALKAVLVELARMEKGDTSKVEALNALRVKELLSLIDEVVLVSVQSIAKEHGLDEDVLLAVFSENLGSAAMRRDAGVL